MDNSEINYRLITSSKDIEPYKKGTDKQCIFCKTTDPKNFKEIPHLIPELLTRNNITYNNECDECNKIFCNEIETHLTNFTRPYILLAQAKTKKGFPKLKMPNGDSIQFVDGQLKVDNLGNSFDMEMDRTTGSFSLGIRTKPYIPFKVYKGLIKIGVSLLPKSGLDNYSETINWLINAELDSKYSPEFLACAFSFSMTTKFSEPFADLYEAKELLIGNTEYVQHILVLGFANFVIQMFLPISKEFDKIHNPTNNLGLEILPLIANLYRYNPSTEMKITPYKLSSKSETTHKVIFDLTYSGSEKLE